MDSSDFARVREAFEASLALPAGERLSSIQVALSDAPELLAQAERMLAAHDSSGGFLSPPSPETLASLRTPESVDGFLRPGQRVGDFELVRPIGAGGMGEVWEARQENPSRGVALKALRTGLRTDRARRRFQEEAEVLARLSHPGIAQVLASGVLAAADGAPPRPWFAMELIDGAQPLTAYAVDQPLRRRLLLLREACVAVHHGHLRGVVHRDLKPDNLLVDSSGRVRVIDFGIARATDSGDSQASLTGGGELLGTLAYMSPEQIRGDSDRIDVRTDVHALGVLLYELLTARSPWQHHTTSWTALAREVCDDDPRPPSALASGLSPELDWIVARAVAKEPERRYASAQELADEIGRFLDHQPLVAGPVGYRYALRKFARRNRPWVVGGAVAVALLALGAGGTGYGLYRSLERGRQLEQRGVELTERGVELDAARREAESRLERAEAINRFLGRTLRGADPLSVSAGNSAATTVGEMLDSAASEIEGAFPGMAAQEGETRLLIGTAYYGQGRYPDALVHLERARDIFAELLPEQAVGWCRASRIAATVRGRSGDMEAAYRALADLRGPARELLDPSYPELAAIDCDLAWAMQELGQLTASAPIARSALDQLVAFGDEFAPMAAAAASHVARAMRATGDDAATEDAYRDALRFIELAYGATSAQAGASASNLGTFLFSLGRNAEAREYFEQSLAIMRPLLGDAHPHMTTTLYNLAAAVHELGEVETGERLATECLAMCEQLWGPNHLETADAVAALGLSQAALGKWDDSIASFDRAAAIRADQLGWDHRRTLSAEVRALEGRLQSDASDAAKADARARLEDLFQHCLAEDGLDSRRTQDVASVARRAHQGHADRPRWDERVIE